MTDRSKIIEVMSRAEASYEEVEYEKYSELFKATAEHILDFLHAEGLAVVPGWQPIESAPIDRLILVYCPSYQGLNAIVCCCQWHEDAGFCVDELRSPSHWMPLPAPPTNSTKEESDE